MPDEKDKFDEPRNEKKSPTAEPSAPASASPDPNDIVPVPVAMEPAEIDERARVVEALREKKDEAQRHADARVEPEREP